MEGVQQLDESGAGDEDEKLHSLKNLADVVSGNS